MTENCEKMLFSLFILYLSPIIVESDSFIVNAKSDPLWELLGILATILFDIMKALAT
jgi:hypothetical protein